jgi:hypothetical protein
MRLVVCLEWRVILGFYDMECGLQRGKSETL